MSANLSQSDPCYVFGFQLDGNGGGAMATDTSSGQCWFHIDYSFVEARDWLRALELDDTIVDALCRVETRPRAAQFEQGSLLCLRGINLNPGAEPEDMVSLRIWIEKDRIVTVRQRRLLAVQDLRAELEQGRGPRTVSEVMMSIVERLADRVSIFVDELEERLGNIEEQIERDLDARRRQDISSLRRQTAMVRRYLAPQKEALDTFFRFSRSNLAEAELIREHADRFARYVEDLDLVRERAMVLQEELLNLAVQRQGDRMYALSIIAAVFLPITFISGVFGMNVAGLPGIESPDAFMLVAASMVGITAAIVGLFKMKGWL